MRVFLGGTCNGSTWREELKPLLKADYFDPVVPDWTPECQAREIEERQTCDLILYVITPKLTGVYAIAEVVDDSNKRPARTIFCVLPEDSEAAFTKAQLKSLAAVRRLVFENGATIAEDLADAARIINTFAAGAAGKAAA